MRRVLLFVANAANDGGRIRAMKGEGQLDIKIPLALVVELDVGRGLYVCSVLPLVCRSVLLSGGAGGGSSCDPTTD